MRAENYFSYIRACKFVYPSLDLIVPLIPILIVTKARDHFRVQCRDRR